MSNIELKPCPFCGTTSIITTSIRFPRYGRYAGKGVVAFSPVCDNYDCVIYRVDNKYFYSRKSAAKAWNRRAYNKPIRQSCKSCKHYAPDPNYRDGDMGNCRYLEKIWKKPFYVNEARAECEHYQAAERINENGNET